MALTIPNEYWTGKGLLELGVPWLTPPAIRFLESILKPDFSVLEFGGGGSTVFFSHRCSSVVTWENNAAWRQAISKRLATATNARPEPNLDVALSKGQYDVVLVDSEDPGRAEICRRALARVKPGGWLILDNYSRYNLGFLGAWVQQTYDDEHWSGNGTLIARRMKNSELPLFINSKDRLSCLMELLRRLRSDGFERITIIDTGSTQPELLEYYEAEKLTVRKCETKANPKDALWDCGLLDVAPGSCYLYTDCDIVPDYGCPSDWPARLAHLLEKYPRAPKAGLGLRIDDLPAHYALRDRVLAWESKWWKKLVEPDVYEAEIDTTMALYRYGSKKHSNALRTGGLYLARHLPWYAVTKYPTLEHQHYLATLHPKVGHWSRFEHDEAEKPPVNK